MHVRLLGTGSAEGWPSPWCSCASCRATARAGVLRSSAIVGASRPEQVRDNVAAAGVKLDPDLMTRIDEVLEGVVTSDPAKTESPRPRP